MDSEPRCPPTNHELPFPTEIWQLVFLHVGALDCPSSPVSPRRCSPTLKSLALACRAFRPIAQELLLVDLKLAGQCEYDHERGVLVWGQAFLADLLFALGSPVGRGVTRLCLTLDLSSSEQGSGKCTNYPVLAGLRDLPNVQYVELHRFSLSDSSLGDLVARKSVQSLILRDCYIAVTSGNGPLLEVKDLCLKRCRSFSRTAGILQMLVHPVVTKTIRLDLAKLNVANFATSPQGHDHSSTVEWQCMVGLVGLHIVAESQNYLADIVGVLRYTPSLTMLRISDHRQWDRPISLSQRIMLARHHLPFFRGSLITAASVLESFRIDHMRVSCYANVSPFMWFVRMSRLLSSLGAHRLQVSSLSMDIDSAFSTELFTALWQAFPNVTSLELVQHSDDRSFMSLLVPALMTVVGPAPWQGKFLRHVEFFHVSILSGRWDWTLWKAILMKQLHASDVLHHFVLSVDGEVVMRVDPHDLDRELEELTWYDSISAPDYWREK